MNRLMHAALAAACAGFLSTAGAAVVTTVAGGGMGDGEVATVAGLASPTALARDAAGNLYVGDQFNARIRKITLDGRIHTVAGSGVWGSDGDGGLAGEARIYPFQYSIGVDAAGNIYFRDTSTKRVRKVTPSGVISHFAGNGSGVSSGDGGPAAVAGIQGFGGVGVDSAGNVLICDGGRIRKVSPGGAITTHAIVGQICYDVVGGAQGSYDVTNDGGVVHVAADGTVTRVLGSGALPPFAGSPPIPDGAIAANVAVNGSSVKGIARDSAGNLLFSYPGGGLRKVDAGGVVSTVNAAVGGAIVAGDAGEFYLVGLDLIWRIDIGGAATVIAGIGNHPDGFTSSGFLGDGLPAVAAALRGPGHVGMLADGSLLIPDGNRLRKVGTEGRISTIGGASESGASAEGGVLQDARFNILTSAVADPAGNMYLADLLNRLVRKVSPAGIVTTFAGTGGAYGNSSAPGQAIQIALGLPKQVLFRASTGNLYLLDDALVRKIDPTGFMSTIAGVSNDRGYRMDGVNAATTSIEPASMALDASGNLYLAEYLANRIRRVDAQSGIITTIAGTGVAGFAGDGGPATQAQLNLPSGVAVDASGNVYISDTNNRRIRKVAPDGVITTITGTGAEGTCCEGAPPLAATFMGPRQLLWDPSGSLLVTDRGVSQSGVSHIRIRRVGLDSQPQSAFSFPSVAGVAVSSLATSNAVQPQGFAGSVAVAVAGGEYSIGCGATFTAATGTLAAGQSICVRHVSAPSGNRETTTVLTVGSVSAGFTSRTAPDAGALSLDPGSVAFGPNSLSTTAGPRIVTLRNAAQSAALVYAVRVDPPFAASHQCSTVAAGGSCEIFLTYPTSTAGAVSATLSVDANAGTLTAPVTGTGERTLVVHYYRAILGRLPDAQGKTFWDGETARFAALGANPNEIAYAMAAQFFSSIEYTSLSRDNAGFVTDLYRTFLAREPDPSGMGYWLGQLAGGMPREVVMVWFSFSAEFSGISQQVYGIATSRPEVDVVMDFYRGLLSRLPDPSGFSSWLSRFRAAQCAGAAAVRAEVDAVSREFLASPEYAGRSRTNGQYVGDLYNALLRRGGDPTSVNQWISALAGGQSREAIRAGFAQSPEFQQRVNAIVGGGCLR